MIYINIIKKIPVSIKKQLLATTKQAMRLLHCYKKDLSLTICDDRFIKNLNKKYRKKNKPTDVLSFPLFDKKLLGDIIISLDTAKKNCDYFGTTIFEELSFLLVHGLCHLLGHDHHKKAEEVKMKRLEKKVLYKLFQKNYHA